jgi:hypothetical protein
LDQLEINFGVDISMWSGKNNMVLSGDQIYNLSKFLYKHYSIRSAQQKSIEAEKSTDNTTDGAEPEEICPKCKGDLNVLIPGGPGYCHKCKIHV